MTKNFLYCPVLPSGTVLTELASSTPAAAWLRLQKLQPDLLQFSERKLISLGYNVKKVKQNDL